MDNLTLLFDTETSGKTDFKWSADDARQPHLVQIACILASSDGAIHAQASLIIEPKEWRISEDVAAIHGISMERAMATGVPRRTALSVFNMLVAKSKRVTAHNIDFDEIIMLSAFCREKERCRIKDVPRICTMKVATPIVKIPSAFKKAHDPYKWPTLTETYQFLFDETFEGAHDAMVDCKALHRIFFELVKRGHIKL